MFIPALLTGKDMPRHMVIDATGLASWAAKSNTSLRDASVKSVERISDIIDSQIRQDIPIMSIHLHDMAPECVPAYTAFFRKLANDERIHEKRVRVFIIGDWYAQESELVDTIRSIMEKTRQYDAYFLCFMLNYDGQLEILTAAKLILKKAEANLLGIDDLKIDSFKENLASSYFIPPELIIVNGPRYSGSMLWDSKGAVFFFSEKLWPDFERKDIDKAVDMLARMKKLA